MRTRRLDHALLFASLLCAYPLLGQAAAAAKTETAVAPGKYAGESLVIERSDSVYSMAADGTGWRQRTIAVRVQSDAAVRQLGVIGIPFAGSSERVEIQYARVRRADGSVIETPVADALEMPDEVTRAAPFYSDLKQKQLPIRNLRVGDTLEWQAKIVRTKAEAPGEFWGVESFSDEAVTLEQSIELRVPVSKKVTVWSPGHKPVESVVGNERVYRWEASQTKPTTGPEAEAKKRAVWTPEQEADAKDGKLPGIAWTTFASWEAVGAWYRGLEGDRMDPGPEVKAKVAEVTAGKTTEEEKVRAVYGYVATQIRYIGVAFGVGRYQPHRAAEVLENQYGDCKDKHTLLAAMLGALGLKANAVLIGAGVRFNPDVPSPMAFNHLITQVPVGGQTVWLDATAEVAPYRMLVAVIRDHPALVIPEAGVARVEKTPAGLPFKPFQTMDAVGTLDKDGVGDSKIVLTLRGDDELAMRAGLRQFAPAQYDQAVQNVSRAIGYQGTTSHAVISRVDDTAEALTIRYDYHREQGGDWANLRMLPQLAPIYLPLVDEKDPPVHNLLLGTPRVETSRSSTSLPEGWTVEFPDPIHARSAYATLDLTYRWDAGTVYAERRLEVVMEKVPVSDWKAYKKFTDAANLGNESYVQMMRPACAACGKFDAGSAKVDLRAAATGLVIEAYQAIEKRDLPHAKTLLEQAEALNNREPGLWSTYAYLHFEQEDFATAIKEYEKELALYPYALGTYRPLALAHLRLKDNAAAIQVLHRWIAAEPSSPLATSMLVSTLLAEGETADALSAAESGIAGMPEDKRSDPGLQRVLGEAQLKAGMKEKGVATLTGVLSTSENAGLLNDAAYEIADANANLDQAEKGVRKALDLLDRGSRGFTLDQDAGIADARRRMLFATWDTMGWVLFREGKFKEAENYLRACFALQQREVMGEHLGDALAAEGDKGGAARVYDEALAISPPRPVTVGDVGAPMPSILRIRGKMAAAGVIGPHVPGFDAVKELQAMRTVELGPSHGLSGVAEYRIDFGAGGVLRAMPTGAKSLRGGEALIAKAKVVRFFPNGSTVRLIASGFLNCHAGQCELILQP